MFANKWLVVAFMKWRKAEDQAILEGQGIAWTVKHITRKVSNHGLRHIVFTDATAARFAITKGRSSSFAMNRVCRHTAAYLLASGCKLYL